MESKLEIRLTNDWDAEQIKELHDLTVETSNGIWAPNIVGEEILYYDNYGAFDEGKLVGLSGILYRKNEECELERHARILGISRDNLCEIFAFVHPDYKRMGLSTELVRIITEHLHSLGVDVYAVAKPENVSNKIVEKLRFSQIGGQYKDKDGITRQLWLDPAP